MKIGDSFIAGTVKNAKGRGVDHLSIHVYDAGGNLVRATFTDPDGNYKADRLSSGDVYDVAVASISQELQRLKSIPSGSAHADMIASLRDLRGKVVLPDGSFAKNAAVEATSTDWAIIRETKTNDKGEFAFDDLPPALFEVSAQCDQLPSQTARVDLGKPYSQLALRLVAPITLDIQVVERTTKQPLEAVDLNIGEQIAGVLRLRYLGQTDSSGRLRNVWARPGLVELRVSSPLHQDPPTAIELKAQPTPYTLTLTADRSAVVEADLSAFVPTASGQITVIAEPLSLLPKGDVGGYTGVRKNNKLSVMVPPGDYRLHVTGRYLVLRSDPVSVRRGERKTVQLKPQS